ncbi:hypothetical protein GCM10009596_30310 [Arthrobacter rhombi]|uniref:hypothetical protein n=1 Tax=Arthrobacter rhombi TaxID=71253 RepID=UPI0031D48A92
MSTTPDPAEASKTSSALGEQLGTVVTALVEETGEGAEVEIDDVREITCLRPEDDAPQTKTRWIGQVTGPIASTASANAALDRIDRRMKELKWEKDKEVSEPADGTRRLSFHQGELLATAEITDAPPHHSLEIFVRSRCTDQPVEHQMQRSELDPDYGKNSQYYDDWK